MTNWVLVVAADEHRKRLVQAELETAGFEVETVNSVEAAVAWLGVMSPSLIVVDQAVSGMDRLGCAARSGIKAIPLVSMVEAVA